MPNSFLGFPVPWARIASAIEGGILHRRSGATGFDFELGDLTADGNDHDLDVSAIVPEDVSWVMFDVVLLGPTANKGFGIDKDGNYDYGNNDSIYQQAANVNTSKMLLVPCPSDRVFTYFLDVASWTAIGVLVRAWFL